MFRASAVLARVASVSAPSTSRNVAVRSVNAVVRSQQRAGSTASSSSSAASGGRLPYGGFEPHMPTKTQINLAKYLQALMWFWVFYRFKEDGAVMLVRRFLLGVCLKFQFCKEGKMGRRKSVVSRN